MTVGLSDPFLMTLSVFIIQVVVVLCVVFCANKLPRRPLLLITTGIMGVSIFVVGCLGIPGGEVSHTFGKVIISFVIIEITAFNFAWGPLGWTIASEMAVGRNRNKNLRCRGSLLLEAPWSTGFANTGVLRLGNRFGRSECKAEPIVCVCGVILLRERANWLAATLEGGINGGTGD
ncbi:General substrate transporter [Aspergillus oryzae]|uniref:General substrate transporter n=1 Tax=Aspergillus oryzae TaxID=5062 RepID=A0A1S9DR74_ASPOZ|nr:General substrate transporter [Aspergillus oryzae]